MSRLLLLLLLLSLHKVSVIVRNHRERRRGQDGSARVRQLQRPICPSNPCRSSSAGQMTQVSVVVEEPE